MKPMSHCFPLLVVLCACLFSFDAEAQEMQGISNSNYLSTAAIFLNPAASVDSKTYMQLNLVGANAFVMNNIAYVPDFSVYGHKNAPLITSVKPSTLALPKFVYADASINGPAFIISKRNYGAGFFIRARSVLSASAISHTAMSALIFQESDGPQSMNVNLKNTGASTMSWIEYGGNFGMIVKRDRHHLWSVAANLRYLSGINLMYANMTQLKGSYNDSMIHVQSLKGKLRFTDIALNSGRGAAADLGVVYKRMLSDVGGYYPNSVRCNCKTLDYKYKIGLSLRDLGAIRFTKNTSSADVSGSGSYYTNKHDDSYKPVVAALLSTTFSPKPILASLPTALVSQFDWNFENGFYVSGLLIKNVVPKALTGVQAPDLFAITPRYETQQLELAMPLTFQRYLYPQLGFAVRYRTFALGVDNLFPFVKAKNTYGAGIYFSAGISLFKNPACRKKQKRVDRCPTKILKNKGL